MTESFAEDDLSTGGMNRSAPRGGSAYGTPSSWRTLGAVELMKPWRVPDVVETMVVVGLGSRSSWDECCGREGGQK